MHPVLGPRKIEILPIDFGRLELVAETDEEKASLLDLFFKTTGTIIADMTKALASNSQSKWKDAAHKLKGSAGNIGMTPLAKLCLESEMLAWESNDSRKRMMAKIEDELERVRAFIGETASSLLIRKE